MTGVTGHSGRWFIERLRQEGFSGELICLIKEGRDTSHLEMCGLSYRVVWGDAAVEADLERAMAGEQIDILLHIAGIQISRQVVKVAERNQVDWAILVHTTGRYSKYKSASAEYIEIEEEILRLRDRMNITVVRPTMIYGSAKDVNMHKLIRFLEKHRFYPVFGSGKNLMQPVHARDLGNAYYDIIMNRDKTINREYNLPGAAPLPYAKIIEITAKELGKKVYLIKFPIWLSVLGAKVYNAVFGKRAIISVEQVLRMQEDKDFPYDDAARDFGYSPMGFAEGIREEIESMKKDGLL